MNFENYVDQWIYQLKSPNLRDRIFAARQLGQSLNIRAIQPLIEALDYHGPYYEFEEIHDALLNFGGLAVPPLIEAIDRYNDFCGYILQVLSDFKDERALMPMLKVLDEAKKDTRAYIPHALAKLGEIVIDPLIERVENHPNIKVQQDAMETLALISSPRVAEFAEKQLQNPIVRSRAIDALGNRATVKDIDKRIQVIVPYLDDPSPSVRGSAALALGKLHDEQAVEPLVQHLDENSIDVKLHIISALGWIRSVKALEPLIQLINDSSFYLPVIEALGEIGDKRAIAAILPLRDGNKYQYLTDQILKKLGYVPHDTSGNDGYSP